MDLAQMKGMIVVQKGKVAFKSARICTQWQMNEPAQGKRSMDKFSNMSVFVKVVEMGSFTAVANHLDSTVGNVSRAVSRHKSLRR